MKRIALFSSIVVFLLTHSLLAWSEHGHEIVGQVADDLIKTDTTRNKIKEILGNETMSEVSTWADEVKKLQPNDLQHPHGAKAARLAQDADSVAFVAQFHPASEPQPPHKYIQGSGPWHFVNLPLGAAGYDAKLGEPFVGTAKKQDVVMRILECVKVLQDPNSPIHGAFGKRNALRFLVHLVGDIHQPLHVGSGYLDLAAAQPTGLLVKDPKAITDGKLKSDGGGNSLYFSLAKGFQGFQELHAFWDDTLVEDELSASGKDVKGYAKILADEVGNPPEIPSDKPIETAVVGMANEAFKVTQSAYQGIVTTSTKDQSFPSPFPPGTAMGYLVELPPGYEASMQPLARQQLQRGGTYLAALLKTIFP